jgi:hypothetical protein
VFNKFRITDASSTSWKSWLLFLALLRDQRLTVCSTHFTSQVQQAQCPGLGFIYCALLLLLQTELCVEHISHHKCNKHNVQVLVLFSVPYCCCCRLHTACASLTLPGRSCGITTALLLHYYCITTAAADCVQLVHL